MADRKYDPVTSKDYNLLIEGLNKRGFKRTLIKRNGSCGFACLAEHVLGNQDLYMEVRSNVRKYVENNIHLFKADIEIPDKNGNINNNIQSYLNGLYSESATGLQWADSVALHAAGLCYGLRVILFETRMKAVRELGNLQSKNICYMSYWTNFHFDYLKPPASYNCIEGVPISVLERYDRYTIKESEGCDNEPSCKIKGEGQSNVGNKATSLHESTTNKNISLMEGKSVLTSDILIDTGKYTSASPQTGKNKTRNVRKPGIPKRNRINKSANVKFVGRLIQYPNIPSLVCTDIETVSPICADTLEVNSRASSLDCSFLCNEHFFSVAQQKSAIKDGIEKSLNNFLLVLFHKHNGNTINMIGSQCRCCQCLLVFKDAEGFYMHVKKHHTPSFLLSDLDKKHAGIASYKQYQLEMRDEYIRESSPWRALFIKEGIRSGVVSRNFECSDEFRKTLDKSFVNGVGLGLPAIMSIAEMNIELLPPRFMEQINPKHWNIPASIPLSKSQLQSVAKVYLRYADHRRKLSEARGKLYVLLLVPNSLAKYIIKNHEGKIREVLKTPELLKGHSPVIIYVGKTSQQYQVSTYHFKEKHVKGTVSNLLRTGYYSCWLVGNKNVGEKENNYQEILEKSEMNQIMYTYFWCAKDAKNLQPKFICNQEVFAATVLKYFTIENILEVARSAYRGKTFLNLDDAVDYWEYEDVLLLDNTSKMTYIEGKSCDDCNAVFLTTAQLSRHEIFHQTAKNERSFPNLQALFSGGCNVEEKKSVQEFSYIFEQFTNALHSTSYTLYLVAFHTNTSIESPLPVDDFYELLIQHIKSGDGPVSFYVGIHSGEGISSYHFDDETNSSIANQNLDSYLVCCLKMDSDNAMKKMEAFTMLVALLAKQFGYKDHPLKLVNKNVPWTTISNLFTSEEMEGICLDVFNKKKIFGTKNASIGNDALFKLCKNDLKLVLQRNRERKQSIPNMVEDNSDENLKSKIGSSFETSAVCALCQAEFSNVCNLQKHVKSVHGKKLLRCSGCDKRFNTKAKLSLHYSADHLKKIWKCPVCTKGFSYYANMSQHLRRMHEKALRYKCDICKKRFCETTKVREHVQRFHHPARKYKCSICSKDFKTAQNLRQHKNVHSSNKPFSCNNCPASFKYQTSLSQHQERHENLRQHLCEFCGKGFNSKSNLKGHLTIHKGVNLIKYFCDICEKNFYRVDVYNQHMQRHKNERKLKCVVCNKGFNTHQGLFQHKLTHTDSRLFICDLCPKAFKTKKNLSSHKKTHIKVSFICKSCNWVAQTATQLQNHENQYHVNNSTLDCKLCRVKFESWESLLVHGEIHSNIYKKCYVCGKEFKGTDKSCLKDHLTAHSYDKPYKCTKCGLAYKQRGSLNSHYRKKGCKSN